MTFKDILDKYRKISFSERDKGDRFERLMQAYLKTDPKYAAKFKEVYLWNEFPARKDLGGQDTGIDLVALTHEGDYWAVQCKFYRQEAVIDKGEVDSFLATSSRTFLNEQLQTTKFAERVWISTTNKWGRNAEEAIRNQHPAVTRINLFDLYEAPVDWEKLDKGVHGELARTPKKSLFPHQITALQKTHEHFQTYDRGKLIMACGTGKTFASLRIAEHETDNKGLVLFLVPSIALLGQTLRAWSADSHEPINAIAICSDPEITKEKKHNPDTDTFSVVDLAYPASTNPEYILYQFEQIKKKPQTGMTVVFSTYQSIDVIARAQEHLLKNGFPEFDLIICDEAHRTTGISLAGEDESAFTKVHDNDFLKAKKRMYMTATPRIYSDDAVSQAAQADATLCSMDDEKLYGTEMYRIGFGEAVERNLLTDYKVLILTLNDKDVPPAVQKMITSGESEIKTDDLSKLIGTVNALSKQFLGDEGITKETDPEPMRRAVAFCSNIATSKKIASAYNGASENYLESLPAEKKEEMVTISAQHMDGTMAAPQRDMMLSWLKEDTDDNECRIITNVRVLSEGVDVPSLDAVLFLSARNSQVDVVQSVGRVMRRSTGKKYGYIIIPVIVPADVEANKALDDNERYKVVWTVLNALRAHDDRFNATVNKIELNRRKPENILVGRPEYSFDEDGEVLYVRDSATETISKELNAQLAIQFEQLQSVVFARMVQKVGNRRYWEQWAKDVAEIADRQIERITYLIENRTDQRQAFEKFLDGLRKNINPSISEQSAIDMLAQHIITQPVFEALFEGYSFAKNNAISHAMQAMLDVLQGESMAEEHEKLQRFYESVRTRAEGIDNAEGKQRIIIELYDKFFKTAFPKMVEQLGIVYTPVEVVDFIIHSVNDVLKQEFGRSLSDENVHILDPFTGTGTFITRLLQSGLIEEKDLERKYKYELHANEIVLLAYYIAAVNIENAYHDATPDPDDGIGKEKYFPFEGIVLTDTFQMGETDHSEKLFSEMFPENSERVEKQMKAPLTVIMGNPPYSRGQENANDNAQNQSYPKLEQRITNTYAKLTNQTNINALYDAYIKAFRWSTDRLDPKHGGVIAFITNSGWLEANSFDGFRRTLENEFSDIYVYNLRGAIRGKSREAARKEGKNVFNIMTGVGVVVLIKKPEYNGTAKIQYIQVDDYLDRQQKFNEITTDKSFFNRNWKVIKPNEHGDWLNKRNESFIDYIPINADKKFDLTTKSFFKTHSLGVASGRDSWVYNFSKSVLKNKMKSTIDFYNELSVAFKQEKNHNSKLSVDDFIDNNPEKISWNRNLKQDIDKFKTHSFASDNLVIGHYRPFCKQNMYFDKDFNAMHYQNKKLFPSKNTENLIITITGISGAKESTALISNTVADLHFNGDTQCFPLYYYEENTHTQKSLFDEGDGSDYIRRDGISDFIYERAKKQYGKNVTKEDIFYYVYGFLHSPTYRETFANDLKKMLPRVPLIDDVRDFWAFSKAGRKLAELHLNYESVPPHDAVQVIGAEKLSFLDNEPADTKLYRVEKMRFGKQKQEIDGTLKNVDDKSTIIYNSAITISHIPEIAYEYVVNGKSAIEWIMERYQIKTDKASGITNNPNDWADEVGKPRYILDLLLSIINVSMQTVEIVEGLPEVEFGEE